MSQQEQVLLIDQYQLIQEQKLPLLFHQNMEMSLLEAEELLQPPVLLIYQ
jgi:hypothetical protein